MTTQERLDQKISEWLEADAPRQLPDRVLQATFERTQRSRQHRGWRVPSSVHGARFAAALGAVAVLAVAFLALGGFFDQSGVASRPSPVPVVSPVPSATPSAGPSSTGSAMWPQTSLEEVRQAQELADAGDPRYAWQVSQDRWYQPGQHHPMSDEFFARFLREQLGWEAFRWDEAFAHRDGLVGGDVIYVRCAPGGTNPLYPDDPEGCGPTLDDRRYETVKIHVAQPVRVDDPAGLWVVTGWETIDPAVQEAPATEADVAALMDAFLAARVAGSGAEAFVDVTQRDPLASARTETGVPLLYATSTGAPYQRSEWDLGGSPHWPDAHTPVTVRLFAANGATVVEQRFTLVPDATGRPRLVYDFATGDPAAPSLPTMENGKAVPVEYAFLDGLVTYRAAYPLEPGQDESRVSDRLAIVGTLPNDDAPREVLFFLADPRPPTPGCGDGTPAADAEALARSVASDPDVEATEPTAMTIGGHAAWQVDVAGLAGADCLRLLENLPFAGPKRARLWMLDLPGGSASVLVMATVTDEDSFESVLEYATPVVQSVAVHS